MTDQNEFKPKKVEDIKKEAEEKHCPVQRSLYYIENFLSDSMCGKCFPCAYGTYEAKIRLKNIISGIGTDADFAILRRIAEDARPHQVHRQTWQTRPSNTNSLKG